MSTSTLYYLLGFWPPATCSVLYLFDLYWQSLRNQTQTHVTLVSMVTTFLNPAQKPSITNFETLKTLKPLRTLKTLIYPQTLIRTNPQDPQKHSKLFDWLAVT